MACLVLLSACSRDETAAPAAARPVQVVTITPSTFREALVLSGDIQARTDVDLAFRIDGRVVERPVAVGDRVSPGQLVARLDSANEEKAMKAAKAAVVAARADVTTTRSAFERQQALMSEGFTTRPLYERALRAKEAAQAHLDEAEAQLDAAADRLRFTELRADSGGVVTARGVEIGEVVRPGRMVVRIARDDGRDAVFDAPPQALRSGGGDSVIRLSLAADPGVSAKGRVREIAPEADPVTRTFRVRVGIEDPPEPMRLGATVKGAFDVMSSVVVAIPPAALTASRAGPAVWVVDPATSTVSLRPVDVQHFDTHGVIVSQGLDPGDVVVAAGAQALHPGQQVRAIGMTKAASAEPAPRQTLAREAGREPNG
nr:efflux RND transporter periplasmic adaptor subunit [Alsobacter ponti]